MACALDSPSFKDFKLPSLDAERPEAYFNTIPYRVWEHSIDCSDTIDKALRDWQLVTGKDASKALGNRSQDLHLCLAPECPPHILPLFVRFGYITFFWDDATDSLDADAHERIQLDLRAAILSEVKLGRHTRCEFEINELYIKSLTSLLSQVEGIDSHFRLKYDVFDSGLAAQTVAPLHTLTWEAYKAHRTKTVGGKVLSRLMPVVNGIRCTDEELDSVANMIRLGDLITGLTNDFHSFHKEFDEHFQAQTLDSIHNGIAVLMSNYGYDENEAEGILKQEVLALETQLMSEYETWNSSTAPKSDDLRRYMFISILTIGGMNRWQSITPRYHRNDFTTTDLDRAQLVGRSYDGKLRLSQYPPPVMAVTVGRKDAIGRDSLLEDSVEPAAEVAPKDKEILAPFEKAPAEKIVLAPWEYIRALPGKKTLGRMIECLESWFQLPKESTDIIRETTRILFDATLMLDDIQDDSQLRRGRPAAHAVFGQPQTINSATYLFVKGSRQLKDLKRNQECGEVFLDELETLAFGQGLELNWRFHTTLPSFQDYLIMVDNKTGAFFRLVLKLLETETESEPNPDLLHLFTLVGRYYQIRDDYMNLASAEYTAKKGFCEDLSEGKFSFPLIHLLENTSSPNNIRGILFNRDRKTELSMEAKQFVVDQMKETGSLAHTKETLDNLFDAMIETFDNVQATLGSNNKLRIFLLWLKI
ncbi:isoprenoid synthase domain-containing protein [Aspergillus venezuelensis]